MGGGSSDSGPTLQQQQLQTEQATTNANLNLEENSQRKSILSSMFGTREFRGSALSRSLAGNTPGQGGGNASPGPSSTQQSGPIAPGNTQSLLDLRQSSASGATPAGGTGASANAAILQARAGMSAAARVASFI